MSEYTAELRQLSGKALKLGADISLSAAQAAAALRALMEKAQDPADA